MNPGAWRNWQTQRTYDPLEQSLQVRPLSRPPILMNVRASLGQSIRYFLVVAGFGTLIFSAFSATNTPLPRVATFHCDITPPLGEPMVWATKLTKVEQPLLAKGIVLEDGINRYVLCALDWCLMGNDTELSFRKTLAAAAGTDP